jgi:hypothetical protein
LFDPRLDHDEPSKLSHRPVRYLGRMAGEKKWFDISFCVLYESGARL